MISLQICRLCASLRPSLRPQSSATSEVVNPIECKKPLIRLPALSDYLLWIFVLLISLVDMVI